ncbi:uncharacterized protein [Periplaneta americana]|uniref:uncharacterized protein n=1 Tax=Periplaneta americana TaxID=6978 RepID=UPI0037E90FB4
MKEPQVVDDDALPIVSLEDGSDPEAEPTTSTSTDAGHHSELPSSIHGEAPSQRASTGSTKKPKHDPLNTEFIYYSASLRNLAPALTREVDRCRTIPWIRKLFGPEYQPEMFRSKRNKYLCSLTITLMNDEVSGVFLNRPPSGALYELEDLACEKFEQAAWEHDTSWEETIDGLPDSFFKNECTIHAPNACEDNPELSADMLDEEFRLFLYLVRPYAALLPNPEDRMKVASWIQLLCSVKGKDVCVGMRSLRNDYIRSLYGCLNELYVIFPFKDYAPHPPLPLPTTLTKGQARPKKHMLDPTSAEANAFLKEQPIPETGAFCYLAITGDLLDSSLGGPRFHFADAGASAAKTEEPISATTGHSKKQQHVQIRSSHVESRVDYTDVTETAKPCLKLRHSGR